MTTNSSCTNANNEMTFSNRVYLDWEQKKQDMILNLGLANNSETDQTPTPTRLIRNCEEVGLFQDLQIVNPFDEVFKKAVENGSTNLQVPVSASDDTLHTPQIDPQLEEASKFQNNTTFTSNSPNEYPFRNVISNIDQRDDGDNPLVIALDQDKDVGEACEGETKQNEANTVLKDARQEIKAAIIKKSSGIVPVAIDKLLDPAKQNSRNDQLFQLKLREMLRQREANKASQSRCRKRKQKEIENMKAENKRLKDENVKLKTVNAYLQEALKKLQDELKEAKLGNDPNGLTTEISEDQSCVQEDVSLSVDLMKKKQIPCNQNFKSQVVTSSSEETVLHNNLNSIAQGSAALRNPIVTSHITPLVLNNQVNISSIPKTSLKPLPIAPKPMQNNNTVGIPVVFVYPKRSPPVILPLMKDSKAQKSNSKKIVRK